MKKELMSLTKDKLVKRVIAWHSNIAKQKMIIIDCKAHIMWLQMRLVLAQRKIDFLENKKGKRGKKRDVLNYSNLGNKVNTFQRSRVKNQNARKR